MFSTLLAIVLAAQADGDGYAPIYAYFLGFAGSALGMILSTVGSGYGIAKSGVGVAAVGIVKPKIFVKSLVPIVMAGMGGIYGLIASVVIISSMKVANYSAYKGHAHFSAGLAVGLTSLPVGLCTGVLGDFGVRATAKNDKVFVGMVLMLVFAGACALYGLIVALLLSVAG